MIMKHKKILLIEDNPDDVELTLRALKKNALVDEIMVARDGQEALDYLFNKTKTDGAKAPTLPEVILLDLKLPKINGLTVLRRIKSDQRTKFIPVIILTTSKEEKDILESYNLGANSYVHKPVNFTKFVDAMNQLSLYWLLLNQSPHRN
jgi:two-component system, response regulator